jgi:hypothetical protein
MHNSQWAGLRRLLVQGGVPFWRIGRTMAEFQDHYTELNAEALRAGLDPQEASVDAADRLGDLSLLADEYVRHAELTTWWGRVPVVQLCIAEGLCVWEQHSAVTMRWSLATMAAAVVTASMLLVLRLSIFGI